MPTMRTKPVAFTIVEILVAIGISTIIFTSILTFFSSGIRLMSRMEKELGAVPTQQAFESDLRNEIGWISKSGAAWSGLAAGFSGTAFYAQDGSIARRIYLGTIDETFCPGETFPKPSERLVLKEYIRFNSAGLTATAATIPHFLSQTGHEIRTGSTAGPIVMGNGYPGSELGTNGFNTQLQYPSDMIGINNFLYVLDSWNDRLIRYNPNTKVAITLLTAQDGLDKPMRVARAWGVPITLGVANDGGKVVYYRLGDYANNTGSTLTHAFTANKTYTFDRIQITPSSTDGFYDVSSGSVNFSWWTKSATGDTTQMSPDKKTIQYLFSTGQTAFEWTRYSVSIDPLDAITDSTASGSRIGRIDFFSGGTNVWHDFFPYYSRNVATRYETNSWSSQSAPFAAMFWTGASYPAAIANPPMKSLVSPYPIANLRWSMSGTILNVSYTAYVSLDCVEGKHKTEERSITAYVE